MSSHKSIIDLHRMSLNSAQHSRPQSSTANELQLLWGGLSDTVLFTMAMMSDREIQKRRHFGLQRNCHQCSAFGIVKNVTALDANHYRN